MRLAAVVVNVGVRMMMMIAQLARKGEDKSQALMRCRVVHHLEVVALAGGCQVAKKCLKV